MLWEFWKTQHLFCKKDNLHLYSIHNKVRNCKLKECSKNDIQQFNKNWIGLINVLYIPVIWLNMDKIQINKIYEISRWLYQSHDQTVTGWLRRVTVTLILNEVIFILFLNIHDEIFNYLLNVYVIIVKVSQSNFLITPCIYE